MAVFMPAGDLHSIPISHGEGRFIASDEQIRALIANGQVATLYTDHEDTRLMTAGTT